MVTLPARSILAALLVALACAGLAAPDAAAQPPDAAGPEAGALRARLASGDSQGVLDVVLSLVKAGKDDVERVLLGCEAAINVRDYGAARSLADIAEAKAPDDPRSYLWNGHALYRIGEMAVERAGPGGLMARPSFADSAAFYRKAREKGADPGDAAYWEADAALQSGHAEDALAAARAALKARPDFAAPAAIEGRALLQLGRASEASAALAAAAARNPGDRALALLQLEASLAGDDRTAARAVFLDAVRRFPQDREFYDAWFERLRSERPDSFLRESLEAARKAADPKVDPFPIFYLGRLHELSERAAEALVLYEEYRAIRPTHPEGHHAVGLALVRLGRLEDAKAALHRANALGGMPPADMAEAWRFLTGAYVSRRDMDTAARLQSVVVSLTHDADDLRDLAVLEYGAGRHEEGIALYRQLLARDDLTIAQRGTALNYFALALLGDGRKDEAERAFRDALAVDDTLLDARENLALLLAAAGKTAEARTLLEQVVARSAQTGRSAARSLYHLMRLRHPDVVGARSN